MKMRNENVERIRQIIGSSSEVKKRMMEDDRLMAGIDEIVSVCIESFKSGNAVYFCGNGGSAADAQHLAAELSGRFYFDREPLPSEALHVNSSYLTAVANDYGYDQVFSRMIKAVGKKGDILIGLSTSGNSPNVVNALKEARQSGMTTIGFTGARDCEMDRLCDHILKIPSDQTPRIQEAHIMAGHIICELIEEGLFDK